MHMCNFFITFAADLTCASMRSRSAISRNGANWTNWTNWTPGGRGATGRPKAGR